MKKTENPKIKEFLIMFSSETLEQCTLFTQTFGNGFARMRLEQNVQKVFTNEFSTTVNGYQYSADKSITLCTSNRDDAVLTVEELQKDRSKLSTLLHEAIHAILSRDEEECKKFNIVSGTGIMEQMVNQQGEKIEVGRGLNEGLTDWICGHAGYVPNSYPELTSFVCELELAIGSQRVMKLGKGNIRRNVAKQLNMSESECIGFLMQVDQVYQIQDKHSTLNNWKTILENYLKSNISQDGDFKRSSIHDYQRLQKNDDYIETICSKDYQKYLDDNSLGDSNETRIEYLKQLIASNQKGLPDLIANIESKIFDKYFKREWEEILKSGKIDLNTNTFFRFNKLSEFFKKTNSEMQQNAINSLSQFLAQFEIVKSQYFEGIKKLAENDFRKGSLTIDRAKELFRATSKISEDELLYLIGDVSQLMYPEDASAVQSLLFKLQKDNRLEDIKEYYIHCANTENKSVYLFFRNGQLEFTSDDISSKKMSVKKDDVKDFYDVFDCTLMLDEDEQEIIKEFCQIKKAAEAKNPNANITISGRTIVIDFGDRINVYLIDKGMILPAKLENKNPIKVGFQRGKKNILPAEIDRNSLSINKFITKIKQIFSNYSKKENNGEEKDFESLKKENGREFRKKYVANVEPVVKRNVNRENMHGDRYDEQQEEK